VTVERAGYNMLTAVSRAEGMEKVKSERPDLIILDAMIETWQDGFEMSRDLKNDPRFKNMPILMLTIIEEKTGIEMKSAAGDPAWLPVDGFLDKPVSPDVLLAEIRKLLPSPQVEPFPR
jgi:CheY-like chemotaxis protein